MRYFFFFIGKKYFQNKTKTIRTDDKRIQQILCERPGKCSCWLNKIMLIGILISYVISALIMYKWAKIIYKTFQKHY